MVDAQRSGSDFPAEFWNGASAGLALALVGLSAVTGSFFGTGLGRLVESLIGAVLGLCVLLLCLAAVKLLRGLLLPGADGVAVAVLATLATLWLIRESLFFEVSKPWRSFAPELYYPGALAFCLAQAALFGVCWLWWSGALPAPGAATRRRLFGVAWIALFYDLLLVGWIRYEGRDPYPVSVSRPESAPPTLALDNPANEGDYTVTRLTYGSGTDVRRPEFGATVDIETPTVDASRLLPEWKGFKARWRQRYWGFSIDEAPLNGRVWMPESDADPGPFPLVLVVHGNHRMEEHSDPGYAYLGELLASRGFITVSVDENFINGTWSGDFRGREMPARAWLLLEHLRTWREWSQTPGHRLHGKADMAQIGLIGHSRGGEAVAIAAAYNDLPFYPDDATVAFDYGFSIRSLVAIAQIDKRYQRRVKLENLNFLGLQGSYDADEASFHGLRQFRRISLNRGDDDEAYWFKAGIYIHGANHGQFNTEWGRRDSGPPGAWLLNLEPLIAPEEQREVAKVAISGFLEATLRGKAGYVSMFRDPRVAADWLPSLVYLHQFDDSTFQGIASYEEDIDVTTVTRSGWRVVTRGLALWREEELLFRDDLTQGTNAVVIGWDPARSERIAEPSYALERVAEDASISSLTGEDLLSFFLAASEEKPTDASNSESHERDERVSKSELDVVLELTDAAGTRAAIPLSEIAPITPPLNIQFRKHAFLSRSYGRTWEPTLQSYEIPLSAFQSQNPELDPARLTAVRFRFGSDSSGTIVLDDIGFRGSPPSSIDHGERADHGEAERSQSGDGPTQ